MLKINVFLAGTGKAIPKTKMILDAYLERRGHNAWMGPVSSEAFKALQKAVSRALTKRAAVSFCFFSKGKVDTKIIGKRALFGKNGQFPLRLSSIIPDNMKKRKPFNAMKIIDEAVGYEGVIHDWGKMTKLFGKKITKDKKAVDPVRHEVVSLAMIKHRETFCDIQHCLSRAAKTIEEILAAKDLKLIGINWHKPSNLQELCAFLIVSHHRLLAGKNGVAGLENHIGDQKEFQRKSIETPAPGAFDHATIKALSDKSDAALQCLSEEINYAGHGIDNLLLGVFMWARLASIAGDHTASAQDAQKEISVRHVMANQKHTLDHHLRMTAKFSKMFARILPRLHEILPGVSKEDRAKLETPAQRGSLYQWQNALASTAETIANEEDSHLKGLFCVILSQTGAGKTQGAMRMMSCLHGNDEMRVTVPIGLRSLTEQTGQKYSEEDGIGLPETDIAIVTGTAGILDGLAQEPNADDEDDVFIADEPRWENWDENDFFKAFTSRKKMASILFSPVLACTIDYIMRGADWSLAKHIVAQLRIASSDMILDEFDDYSTEDVPAIARLCFLVGLFGKRAILCSATASPEIVNALHASYQHGRDCYALISGSHADTICVAASDICAPSRFTTSKPEEFKGFYQTYLDNHCVHLKKARNSQRPIRRHKILAIEQGSTVHNAIHRIADGVIELHDCNLQHHENLKYSVGLCRVTRVLAANEIKRHIENNSDEIFKKTGVRIMPLVYTRRRPYLLRYHLEQELNAILHRKPNKGGDAKLIEFIDNRRPKTEENICVLVIATTIAEIGRDHDYDFAVVEPSSSRSTIQCIGRVNRHRRRPLRDDDHFNIYVLEYSLRWLDGDKQPFAKPGFEMKSEPLKSHNMREIGDDLLNRLDASPLLERRAATSDTPLMLPDYERHIVGKELQETVIKSFIDSYAAKYTDTHMKRYRFRQKRGEVAAFFNRIDDCRFELCALPSCTAQKITIESGSKYTLLAGNDYINKIIDDFAGQLGADVNEEFCKKYLRVEVPAYMLQCSGDSIIDVDCSLGIVRSKKQT